MCDTDVTYKFADLSDSAKEKARCEYRGNDYPGYDWWDSVYEDAAHMGALIGINIISTRHDSERTYKTIDISFSGFWSQGDGASFEGSYRLVPDAVQKVTAETDDEELIRIAQQLTLLQITHRLQNLEPFSATISTLGHYNNSGSVHVDVTTESESFFNAQVDDDLEGEVTQLMRDFADWIYKRLEAEYDYLTSDEYVDQYLNDSEDEYDEFGSTI